MSNLTIRSALLRMHDKDTVRTQILRSLANAGKGLYQTAQLTTGTAVVDGDTLDIGGVGFVLKSIGTTTSINGTINSTTTGTTLTMVSAPATAITSGEVLRLQNEYVKVTRVDSTLLFQVQRGFAGSTAATQTATAVFRGATAVQAITGGRFVIPTAGTYTNTVIRPLIVTAVNAVEAGIGSGMLAVDSGGGGVVDFIRPWSAAGLVSTGATATVADGSATTLTFNVNPGLLRGDVIKCENEYLQVAQVTNSLGTILTVTRAYNGSTGAAHTAAAVSKVQSANSFSRITGSSAMATEWSGGVDDLSVTKAEYVHAWVSGTSFTLWLAAGAKAAQATLYDASASLAPLVIGATAPTAVLSLTNRKLVVTEGSTAFATGDIIVVTVWY